MNQPLHHELRVKRFAHGITQIALAKRAGINITYINNWERGRQILSDEQLDRVKEALDVLIEERNGSERERSGD